MKNHLSLNNDSIDSPPISVICKIRINRRIRPFFSVKPFLLSYQIVTHESSGCGSVGNPQGCPSLHSLFLPFVFFSFFLSHFWKFSSLLGNRLRTDILFTTHPVFGILNKITGDQPEIGIGGRKDPYHSSSATYLFVNPLE